MTDPTNPTPEPQSTVPVEPQEQVRELAREMDRLGLSPEMVPTTAVLSILDAVRQPADPRIEDIFGLWVQGKRDDRWVAERLIEEGHLAALPVHQDEPTGIDLEWLADHHESFGVRRAARTLLDTLAAYREASHVR